MADPLSPRIPIVMFHSVGVCLPNWKWQAMTIPYEMFEKQVHLLKSHGYHCRTLTDLPDISASPAKVQQPEVILTFDDGYLDNWVFAYPILKRMGWQGTIYVNPEFIDPSETPRPTLEDVWAGTCAIADLQSHGFLNRAELRLLQESGVMEIASHSMSHTWFPTGPEIQGFHNPHQNRPWLGWNAQPHRKFAYLVEDQSEFVPFGTPIYANGRSLGIRRFFPDSEATVNCVDFVKEQGGKLFFDRPDWKDELTRIAATTPTSGRYETDAEMTARYRYEICESRNILADITGHSINHFCWPGGAYCDQSWNIATEENFQTITVTSGDRIRWSESDPRFVRRIGCGRFVAMRKNRYRTDDPAFLLMACEIERGRKDVALPLRIKKLLLAARHGFKASVIKLP